MRLRMLAVASVAIAGMGIATVSTPVQAKQEATHKATRTATHCVTDLSTPKHKTTCYKSFRVAIAKATDGRITDAPDNVRVAMSDKGFQAKLHPTVAIKTRKGTIKKRAAMNGGLRKAAVVQTLSPIGIVYDDEDYGGDSHIYTATSGCTGPTSDVDWQVEYVGSRWNDDISSYRVYWGCWMNLFEHRGWQGLRTGYRDSQPKLGSFNNEASSIRWS